MGSTCSPFSQWGVREDCSCVSAARICVCVWVCMRTHGCLRGVNCGLPKWRSSWSPTTVVRPPEGRTLEDSLYKNHSALVRCDRRRTSHCSCTLCPVWGSRDTALCTSVEARRWLTHAAALTHIWKEKKKHVHKHTHTCALQVDRARRWRRPDTGDHLQARHLRVWGAGRRGAGAWGSL